MAVQLPQYLPRHINRYVPAMGYDSLVKEHSPIRVDFGTPAAASAAAVLASTAADAILVSTPLITEIDARYGRCLTATGSAGADTLSVTIVGRDYLGQPMKETIVAGDGVATAGVKAFKWIESITNTVDATETFTVGTSDKLGLPYKMMKVISEELDDVIVGTLGTLVTPSLVDPQTAVTTDPRGTYDPQSTLTGSAKLTGHFLFSDFVNAAGNGGLHGLKHFFS